MSCVLLPWLVLLTLAGEAETNKGHFLLLQRVRHRHLGLPALATWDVLCISEFIVLQCTRAKGLTL